MRTISPRFLPASRVKAGSYRLGRLAVRSSDGAEIGKLLGFIVDAATHQLCSLVIERDNRQLEIPMAPLQFDLSHRSLQLVNGGCPEGCPIETSALPQVTVEDLWIPMFTSAA